MSEIAQRNNQREKIKKALSICMIPIAALEGIVGLFQRKTSMISKLLRISSQDEGTRLCSSPEYKAVLAMNREDRYMFILMDLLQ